MYWQLVLLEINLVESKVACAVLCLWWEVSQCSDRKKYAKMLSVNCAESRLTNVGFQAQAGLLVE